MVLKNVTTTRSQFSQSYAHPSIPLIILLNISIHPSIHPLLLHLYTTHIHTPLPIFPTTLLFSYHIHTPLPNLSHYSTLLLNLHHNQPSPDQPRPKPQTCSDPRISVVYLQVHCPDGQAQEEPHEHEQPGPACLRKGWLLAWSRM